MSLVVFSTLPWSLLAELLADDTFIDCIRELYKVAGVNPEMRDVVAEVAWKNPRRMWPKREFRILRGDGWTFQQIL